jgi:hypothetical protein
MDAVFLFLQRLALAGLIFCAAAASILWIVRTTYSVIAPRSLERQVVIAPVVISGKTEVDFGKTLAVLLQARINALQDRLRRVSSLLRHSAVSQPVFEKGGVESPHAAVAHAEVFHPLNITFTVAGADVGSLLDRAQEILSRSQLTQIAAHYDGNNVTVSGDVTALGLTSLWLSGEYKTISELATDIAYEIIRQQQAIEYPDFALLDISTFRQTVELLSNIGELNAKLQVNMIEASAYRQMLVEFDALRKKTTIHWMPLIEVMGQVAETSGDTMRAIQLYEEVLSTRSDSSKDEMNHRDRLTKRVAALKLGTATPVFLSATEKSTEVQSSSATS